MIAWLKRGFPRADQPGRPFGWAVVAVLFLAPFFFSTYGYATHVTAALPDVPSVVFAWEHLIPFWPWTIVPYWSIDLLYGLALLLCTSRRELGALVKSLLTVQILSIACFLAFPLRFTFERPRPDGIFGALFDILMGFDKPFNQAPSLHIGLLVILWIVWARHAQGPARAVVHIWFFLIGLSVLTTYQHHFLDVPTGALAGAFSAWLWPHQGTEPWRGLRLARAPLRQRIGAAYLLGSALLIWLGTFGGGWLWSLWPATSLLLVGGHYLVGGPHGFQKTSPWPTPASFLLHAPYTACAWINSRLWSLGSAPSYLVADNVMIGRIPSTRTAREAGHATVLDLAAELPGPRVECWIGLPCLDLVAPGIDDLVRASDLVESSRARGPVMVCCALGRSRSALVVAAWLVRTGRAGSADQAMTRIRQVNPKVVLPASHRELLQHIPSKASA